MAKITKSLSSTVRGDGKSEIMLRASLPGDVRIRLRSGLFVEKKWFGKNGIKKPRMMTAEYLALRDLEGRLAALESSLLDYAASHPGVGKSALEGVIERFRNGGQEAAKPHSDFFSLWREYIDGKDISIINLRLYKSLVRALRRYEMFLAKDGEPPLEIGTFNPDGFIAYYRDEPRLYELHPDIFEAEPVDYNPRHKLHKPQPRGDNAIVETVKRLRAFFNWCVDKGHAGKSPMLKYQGVKSATYGTPFYLTLAERDRLAECDLSARPELARQRDVFVFQCHVGCRISDLYSLTPENIVGGALEYVPGKTSKSRLDRVRVPLTATAKAILERYSGGPALLPLISKTKYNVAIKRACKACGIDRVVTVINPATGKDERRPIWEVASSHMARRTFVGNLYKQVKDPSLVGALSGHKEGSTAFARYREIDDDIRNELISLME